MIDKYNEEENIDNYKKLEETEKQMVLKSIPKFGALILDLFITAVVLVQTSRF